MVNLHILSLLAISHVTAGLVTLHTIREVTNITRDATAEIIGSGLVRLGESVGVGNQFGRRPGQVMLGAADDDDGEVEDVSCLPFLCFISPPRCVRRSWKSWADGCL